MHLNLVAALLLSTSLWAASAQAQDAPLPPLGPDELNFSTGNMDTSVSPREDFYRYVAGSWLDKAVIPATLPDVNVFSFMGDHVTKQMASVIAGAAADADRAKPGTPAQQVGDFYNAYMDIDRVNGDGIAALQPALDRLEAVKSLDDLATYLGERGRDTASFVFAAIVPNADRADSKKMALWFLSGDLGIALGAIYEEGEDSARAIAYKTFIRDVLVVAGDSSEDATKTAKLVFELEAKLHAGKATPVERVDPRNVYNPVPFADLQAEIPELDLTRLARGLGLEPEETVVKTEPRYLGVLSQVLKDYSLDDIKSYLRFRLIENYSGYLGTDFEAPTDALIQSILGVSQSKPRAEKAQALIQSNLGQPLSRLYIDALFRRDNAPDCPRHDGQHQGGISRAHQDQNMVERGDTGSRDREA